MSEFRRWMVVLAASTIFAVVGGLVDWLFADISPILATGGFVLKTFGLVVCVIVISVWAFLSVVGGVVLTLGLLRVGALILHGHIRGKK